MEIICQQFVNGVYLDGWDYRLTKEGNYIKTTSVLFGGSTKMKIEESDKSGKRYIIRTKGIKQMVDFNNARHYTNIDLNKDYNLCLG